ncbi:hypothetical protein B0H16DRAFT_1804648 [Mycena metata]|uniref:Uncharacterized protein n=1 Tax=Mycena metata TaxID=1033252 RepID=A0AAD7JHG9_9AGAR|nr:hypothetical protein B0H16DRAFT_1804648 [Mycena metata]
MFYDDSDYYSATTLDSKAADDDHTLQISDALLNLLDPRNTVKLDEDLLNEIHKWAPSYDDLLGSAIYSSEYPFQDEPVTFDVPLSLARPNPSIASTLDASSTSQSARARNPRPALHVSVTSCPSEPPLCSDDDYDYAAEDRELLEQRPSATQLALSPPLSEVLSPASAKDFGTPSPTSKAPSPADSAAEAQAQAKADTLIETVADWAVTHAEIEVEFAESDADADADGEIDAGSEVDDADGESKSDCQRPAPHFPADPEVRLTIRLPLRRQPTAVSPIPLPPQILSTHEYESDSEEEAEAYVESEPESDHEDADYGARPRPRSAPTAKRRCANSRAAIAVAPPKANGAKSRGPKILVPADEPRPKFVPDADGWYRCPVADRGCPHRLDSPSGISRHYDTAHLGVTHPCPACRLLLGPRRDVMKRHLENACKADEALVQRSLTEFIAEGRRKPTKLGKTTRKGAKRA